MSAAQQGQSSSCQLPLRSSQTKARTLRRRCRGRTRPPSAHLHLHPCVLPLLTRASYTASSASSCGSCLACAGGLPRLCGSVAAHPQAGRSVLAKNCSSQSCRCSSWCASESLDCACAGACARVARRSPVVTRCMLVRVRDSACPCRRNGCTVPLSTGPSTTTTPVR